MLYWTNLTVGDSAGNIRRNLSKTTGTSPIEDAKTNPPSLYVSNDLGVLEASAAAGYEERFGRGPSDVAVVDLVMDEHGLRATLRHRVIAFGTMEPRLRLLSLVALLILALSAAALLSRDWNAGAIPTPGGTSISPLTFTAAIACLAVGVGYLLAGAFHANALTRILALIAFTVLMLDLLAALRTLMAVDSISAVVVIAVYGLFAAILGIGLWSWLSRTKFWGRRVGRPLARQLSISMTLVLAAAILSIY